MHLRNSGTLEAEFKVGFCLLEGAVKATLAAKSTPMSYRPSHHVNSIYMFCGGGLLCFVFSCCRSTNFLGPIRVTAAKA